MKEDMISYKVNSKNLHQGVVVVVVVDVVVVVVVVCTITLIRHPTIDNTPVIRTAKTGRLFGVVHDVFVSCK